MKSIIVQPGQSMGLFLQDGTPLMNMSSNNSRDDDPIDRENIDYKERSDRSHISLKELNYLLTPTNQNIPAKEREAKESALNAFIMGVMIGRKNKELFPADSNKSIYFPTWSSTALRTVTSPNGEHFVQLFHDIDGKVEGVVRDTSGGHVDATFLYGYQLTDDVAATKSFSLKNLRNFRADGYDGSTVQEIGTQCPGLIDELFGEPLCSLSPFFQSAKLILPRTHKYIHHYGVGFPDDFEGMIFPVGIDIVFSTFWPKRKQDQYFMSYFSISEVAFVPYNEEYQNRGKHFLLFR